MMKPVNLNVANAKPEKVKMGPVLSERVINRIWQVMGANYTTWQTKHVDHAKAKAHWAKELGDLTIQEIEFGFNYLKNNHSSDFAPEVWNFKGMCNRYHDHIIDEIYIAIISWYNLTFSHDKKTPEAQWIMQYIDYSNFYQLPEKSGRERVRRIYENMRAFVKNGGILPPVPPKQQKKLTYDQPVNTELASQSFSEIRKILGRQDT